jgi:putative oxidoreductase
MSSERSTGTDLGLLAIRLALGVTFVWHGIAKVAGENAPGLEQFAKHLDGLGVPFPYPAAVATVVGEIGGGLVVGLGLGVVARLGALALAVIMLVAIFKVHLPNGFISPFVVVAPPGVQAGDKLPIVTGFEYNIALLAMSLCVLFAGAGRIGLLSGGKKGG